jgi:hypothetical protein
MKSTQQERKVPEFESEAQEAKWWASNPDRILEQFQSAKAEGRLGHGSVVRRGSTPTHYDPAGSARYRTGESTG